MTAAEKRAERGYWLLLKAAKQIHDYRYEAVKLRLGERLWYTPDWLVVGPSGELRMVEQMGRPERDTLTRIKAAAELYPWFEFAILWQRGKGWEYQTIGGNDEAKEN